jgi:hypothetical protein
MELSAAIMARLLIRHRQLKQQISALYDANKVASLDASLGHVSFNVALQLDDNNHKLPSYFEIPRPVDATHYIVAKDLLTYLVWTEFDSATLPEIRWDRNIE